ncbi:heat shock 70 kDa protein-like [Papaver somniferum]|uniref:heat shock 70 kDa protein-like n=1 Tax=Papaver somniferum TaxID=3469 RepID=UPI000E703F3C|nr:heat shock 70 kDa protein-like [Papaver somniferum]
MNKSWIIEDRTSDAYINGVEQFLRFAVRNVEKHNEKHSHKRRKKHINIRCPCFDCDNIPPGLTIGEDKLTEQVKEGSLAISGGNDILTLALGTAERSGNGGSAPSCHSANTESSSESERISRLEAQISIFMGIQGAEASIYTHQNYSAASKPSSSAGSSPKIVKDSEDKGGKSCIMCLESSGSSIDVAKGKVFRTKSSDMLHNVRIGKGNVRVLVEVGLKPRFGLPIPPKGEKKILLVGEAEGYHVAWPKKLVIKGKKGQEILEGLKNQMYQERTKHIDFKYHFIKDAVEEGKIAMLKVPTADNPANMLTKPVPSIKFKHCLDLETGSSSSMVSKNVVVIGIDLGATGTLSVAVVNIKDGWNIYEVKSVAGDTHLGGKDFDDLLYRHCSCHYNNSFRLRSKSSLRFACEDAKKKLSNPNVTETKVSVDSYYDESPKEFLKLSTTVTQDVFDRECKELFDKCQEAIAQCLQVSGISQFHQVILVGGSTRIPRIREILRARYSRSSRSGASSSSLEW